ncbi:MAG: hypothetical protein JSV03_12025 [Planctomycetota bacterium]|nr:MAG: hypothetical protein JSV03_12025 [Planctomycetota bacterium]
MNRSYQVVQEVPQLYRIISFEILRETPGVIFDKVPIGAFPHIDAVQRVIHERGVISPGTVGDVERPWYMHPYQDDNLIVLHGIRFVDIYTPAHGKVESFVVSNRLVKKNDTVIHEGPAMLVWPRGVFHRIRSCDKEGSASINLAVHYDGYDIRTNFNIYDLDPQTGEYRVIREGHLDQPASS